MKVNHIKKTVSECDAANNGLLQYLADGEENGKALADDIGKASQLKQKIDGDVNAAVIDNSDPDDKNAPKVCYLTFDDGPSENTLKILDILKKRSVKATFFVTGMGDTKYMKRIVDEGHTIALHTYCHDYDKIYSSVDNYFNDLQKISDLVKRETGVESHILRFPGGSSNTISRNYCSGIMSTLTKEVERRGYRYFDWNCDSTDASGNNVAVDRLVSNVKGNATCKSCVVLMHDTGAKDTTVEALNSIIDVVSNKGYIFAGLSEKSPKCHHGVNN